MPDGLIKRLGSWMPAIERWLKNIGLEKYAEVFVRNDVDLDVAPNLSEQDLEKLGLSLGHRRKFLAAAAKLRVGGAQTTDDFKRADAPRLEAADVERRQVTVLLLQPGRHPRQSVLAAGAQMGAAFRDHRKPPGLHSC